LNEVLKTILKPLASLRITVCLLLGSMLLVYVGTLAQRNTLVPRRQFFARSILPWLPRLPGVMIEGDTA